MNPSSRQLAVPTGASLPSAWFVASSAISDLGNVFTRESALACDGAWANTVAQCAKNLDDQGVAGLLIGLAGLFVGEARCPDRGDAFRVRAGHVDSIADLSSRTRLTPLVPLPTVNYVREHSSHHSRRMTTVPVALLANARPGCRRPLVACRRTTKEQSREFRLDRAGGVSREPVDRDRLRPAVVSQAREGVAGNAGRSGRILGRTCGDHFDRRVTDQVRHTPGTGIRTRVLTAQKSSCSGQGTVTAGVVRFPVPDGARLQGIGELLA